MILRFFIVALAAVLASAAHAATFTVTDPAEFQAALTTAQANGEPDTINVAGGTYNVATGGTLTYTAAATENASLVINGADSDLVILDGGSQVPILRIDTTAVISDTAVSIEVRNMTFRFGNAVGVPADGGALAILLDESLQPNEFGTLIGVGGSVFLDNRADGDGGAIYIRGHAVEGIYLDDLTVNDNVAGGDGGGAYVVGGQFTTSVFVSNVDFWNNIAAGSAGGLLAGGFDPNTPGEDRAVSLSLFDILFYNNVSQSVTGNGGGADVSALDVSVNLVGFVDNSANVGGGLYLRPNYSTFGMVNSGFVGNTAADQGGGMDAGDTIFGQITLTNNTFFANAAPNRGGGISLAIDNGMGFARIYNNIIWGNTGSFDSDDLYIDNQALGDTIAVVELFNNVITEWLVTPGPTSAGSNLDADPLFVDMAARPTPDPRLLVNSPAIDAGDDAAPSRPAVDFEGDARPFDGDGDMTATTDIGMDEFTGAIVQNADLAVTQTDNPDPITGGNDVTYTMTVTNNGPADATGIILTGALHFQMTFVSTNSSQGTCGWTGFNVSCQLGNLANGASATATIVATTPVVQAQQDVFNTANTYANETDPDMTDNQFIETTTVLPVVPDSADLAVVKVDTPDPVISDGPTLTYDITVTNNGPDAATGVTLTDTLPAGLESVAVTPGDICAENLGVVTCSIGDLAADASANVQILSRPTAVAEPTDIDNTASVFGDQLDPVAGNDTVTATTTVLPPESDLLVDVDANPSSVNVGEDVRFDIVVTNSGPSANSNVQLTITLPQAGILPFITISQGDCSAPVKGVVDCDIGDMLAPLPLTDTVTAQVTMTAPNEAGTLVLSATASGSVGDPATANNSANTTATVTAEVDLVIQGTSKGTGAIGMLELLLAAAALAIFRARRHIRWMLPCLAAAALVAVPAGEANAEGEWYLNAAIGQADLDYDPSDLTSDLSSLGWSISDPVIDSTETAWKVVVGFQVNPNFAFEAGYVDLGEVATEFGASILPDEISDILADTYSVHPYQGDGLLVAAVVKWPMSEGKAWATARAGALAWDLDLDVRVTQGGSGQVSGGESGTNPMFGLGVEWKVSDKWSVTVDVERYRMDEWLTVPSAGVKVYF